MARLYFTDVIEALYMMKEFGVKLRNFTQKCLKEFEFEDGEKIYVAKESEHIFKPKKGDVGYSRDIVFHNGEFWSDNFGDPVKDAQIIFRNGKQFFQAENETIYRFKYGNFNED